MTRHDRALLKKVKYAMKQVNNGDPLKDFLDDYEILDALDLLIQEAD